MKIIVDTDNKKLTITEDILVKDLLNFLKLFKDSKDFILSVEKKDGGFKFPEPILPITYPMMYESRCPKCNLKLEGVMGYVCPDPQCPVGLNGAVWVSSSGGSTETSTYFTLDIQGQSK